MAGRFSDQTDRYGTAVIVNIRINVEVIIIDIANKVTDSTISGTKPPAAICKFKIKFES